MRVLETRFNLSNILYKVWIFSSTLGVIIVFLVWTLTVIFTNPNLEMVDLIGNLTGARIIAGGEVENLYNLDTQFDYQKRLTQSQKYNRALPFRTPPFVALLFVPLAKLTLNHAYLVFWLINLALLLAFVVLLPKVFVNIGAKKPSLFLLSLFFYPVIGALVLGQLSVLIVIFLLLTYKFMKEKKDFLAGFFASLLILKVQYITFLPMGLLLVNDKKRFLLGSGLVLLAAFLVSVIVAGEAFVFSYLNFLLATEEGFRGSRPEAMYTLFSSVFTPLGIDRGLAFILNFSLYGLVIVFLNRVKKRYSFDMLFVAAILLAILFSVHALNFDLVLLLVAVFILLEGLFSYKIKLRSYVWPALALYILPWLCVVIPGNILTFGLVGIAIYLLLSYKNTGAKGGAR